MKDAAVMNVRRNIFIFRKMFKMEKRVIIALTVLLLEPHMAEGPGHLVEIDINHGWEPVFLGFAGIGESIYDAWVNPFSPVCRLSDGCFSDSSDLTHFGQDKHLRNSMTNHWTLLNVDVVKLELFLDGHRKVWMIFNGRNTNATNWFSKENFMKSNYKDLFYDNHFSEFSIEGEPKTKQRFIISQTNYGCNVFGWLFVEDGQVCDPYVDHPKYPRISYGNMDRKTTFGTGTTGTADLMMISIKQTKLEEITY